MVAIASGVVPVAIDMTYSATVTGSASRGSSRWRMVRAQAAALGREAVILDGRGHGFPQEDPQAFGVHLNAFLETLPGSGLTVETR